MANEKPYSLVLDLDRFTVLTSAEDFCLKRAGDLGITTVDALVTRCLVAVADVIRSDLAKTYDVNSIPQGTVDQLSPIVRAYIQQSQAQAAAPAVKNTFEV